MGQLITSILIMFAITIISFFVKHRGVMPDNTTTVITALLFNVTLPSLIFSSMAGGLGREILGQGISLMGVALGYCLTASLIAMVFLRRISAENQIAGVFAFSALFANTAFLGLPLIKLLFGDTGVVLGAFFDQVQTLFMFTAGIAFLGGKEAGLFLTIKNRLREPPLLAVLIGLTIMVSGLKLPEFFLEPFRMLGNMTPPLAMFAIGQYMDLSCFKDKTRLKLLFPAVFIKLILVPGLVLGITSWLPMTFEMRGVAAIMLACPSAVMAAVLGERYGQDYKFAVMVVVATTVLSIITLPLTMTLLQYFSI